MRAVGDELVINYTIGDCDWSDAEGLLELETERVLFDRWYEHRLEAHRCKRGGIHNDQKGM
jgi:hypothetical protein